MHPIEIPKSLMFAAATTAGLKCFGAVPRDGACDLPV